MKEIAYKFLHISFPATLWKKLSYGIVGTDYATYIQQWFLKIVFAKNSSSKHKKNTSVYKL